MKDRFNQELNEGDIIAQLVTDNNLPVNAKWVVLGFGIEPSSMKQVAVIKSLDKDYIMCAYQWELKFFRK